MQPPRCADENCSAPQQSAASRRCQNRKMPPTVFYLFSASVSTLRSICRNSNMLRASATDGQWPWGGLAIGDATGKYTFTSYGSGIFSVMTVGTSLVTVTISGGLFLPISYPAAALAAMRADNDIDATRSAALRCGCVTVFLAVILVPQRC